MVSSSKIFGTIKTSKFNDVSPWFKQDKIKAIVSDSGLASSYIVSSSIKKPVKNTLSTEQEYYSFLISYAWEDDTKNLQNQFNTYPINYENSDQTNAEKHVRMINAMINHATRDIKDPLDNSYKRWWLGNLLAEAKAENSLTDTLSYDWATNHTAGAFKLDMTGGHYNSHLCFRYHTYALNTSLNNRFFLANDSL